MKTSLNLRLDKRREKDWGLFPLVLAIGHNRSGSNIPLGYDILEKDWDSKNKEVRKSYKGISSVVALNNLLISKRALGMKVITELDEGDLLRKMSVTEVKNKILEVFNPRNIGENDSSDFFWFTSQLINDMVEAKQIGSARIYRDVKNILRTYLNGKSLAFEEMDYKFLKRFEIKHMAKGNSVNSLAVYMRTIRAIYNKAIKSQIVGREFYPFTDYKIKTAPTRKRAISMEEIAKLEALELEPDSLLQFSKDLFFASFYMMGMNFKDIAMLKVGNVVGNRLNYQRSKTAEQFDFEILPQAKLILEKFISSDSKRTDLVFPIIKRTSEIDISKDIRWARARHNRRLKKLAEMAGIEETLTTYVGRHSFATIARNKEIPVDAIKEMLGHSSIKTTQVYLSTLPSKTLDDYNKSLFD